MALALHFPHTVLRICQCSQENPHSSCNRLHLQSPFNRPWLKFAVLRSEAHVDFSLEELPTTELSDQEHFRNDSFAVYRRNKRGNLRIFVVSLTKCPPTKASQGPTSIMHLYGLLSLLRSSLQSSPTNGGTFWPSPRQDQSFFLGLHDRQHIIVDSHLLKHIVQFQVRIGFLMIYLVKMTIIFS